MIGRVKTIDNVKQIQSLSDLTVIDTVSNGSMLAVTSNAVYNALHNLNCLTTQIISNTESISLQNDVRILIDTSDITLTLEYSNNKIGVIADIFAFEDCTVEYYTEEYTTSSLSMVAGTRAMFIYFNGWKYNGMYGAVWN